MPRLHVSHCQARWELFGKGSPGTKTGQIHPNRRSSIRDILLTEKRDAIKPKVKSCFDSGGTLIVVLFGDDNPDPDEDLVASFQAELVKFYVKYSAAPITIWQQNHLRGLLEKFPSLALRVRGVPSFGFYRSLARGRTVHKKGPTTIRASNGRHVIVVAIDR